MKTVPEIDRAFASLIGRSEDMLTIGHPRVPFEQFRQQPPRLECVLAQVQDLPRTLEPLNPEAEEEYTLLLDEIHRFEPKVILLTATEPAQGVTVSALRLAMQQARIASDTAVLLAEFYNGRSGLDYGIAPLRAEALARHPQDLEKHLYRCQRSGLYLLSAHAAGGEAICTAVWERLRATFRTIFLDCSPFWHNILAQRLAPLADGVSLISCRAPEHNQIRMFQSDLRATGARFFGVIMNAAAAHNPPHPGEKRSE